MFLPVEVSGVGHTTSALTGLPEARSEEVKELLRAHTTEIERGNIDYARMFTMVKRKLVQERGLIL